MQSKYTGPVLQFEAGLIPLILYLWKNDDLCSEILSQGQATLLALL
jgi:hypothetical protein